jgi:hypothetical protein
MDKWGYISTVLSELWDVYSYNTKISDIDPILLANGISKAEWFWDISSVWSGMSINNRELDNATKSEINWVVYSAFDTISAAKSYLPKAYELYQEWVDVNDIKDIIKYWNVNFKDSGYYKAWLKLIKWLPESDQEIIFSDLNRDFLEYWGKPNSNTASTIFSMVVANASADTKKFYEWSITFFNELDYINKLVKQYENAGWDLWFITWDLAQFQSKIDKEYWWTEAGRIWNELYTLSWANLVNYIKTTSGAQVTDKEREFLSDIFPDLTKWNWETFITKSNAFRDKTVREFDNKVKLLIWQNWYEEVFWDSAFDLLYQPKELVNENMSLLDEIYWE